MSSARPAVRTIAPEADEPALRDYLSVLSRRRRVIAIFTGITVFVALACSVLQLPVYVADARVLIEQRAAEQQVDASNQPVVIDQARVIDTEVRIIGSQVVRSRVESEFGVDTPAPTITAVTGTNLVSITVHSTDKALAAAVANATANAYITYRQQHTEADLLGAENVLQKQLSDLKKQIAGLDARSRATHGAEQSAALLAQEAATNQYTSLKAQADALSLRASVSGSNATLISPASQPKSPVSPKPFASVILATIAGLLFGAILAYVVEFFDDRLESQIAIEQLLPDLPVLAMIPVVPSWRERTETHVAAIEEPDGSVAEAYRSLRVALQFIDSDRPQTTIQITSSTQGEGKSATSINLAVMFSLAGMRTILVDADLRRPRLHRFVGVPNGVGLSTALLKDLPLSEVIHDVARARFQFVPAGPTPTFPAELLQSAASDRFFAACREAADIVIIDSAPVLPVADPLAVSGHADVVLLVVSAERSVKRNVQRSVSLLGTVAANVVGVVLNEASMAASGADRYAAYTAEDLTPRRRIEKLFRPSDGPAGPAPAAAPTPVAPPTSPPPPAPPAPTNGQANVPIGPPGPPPRPPA